MLFETNLNGHRMEYIHHIYMGMVAHPQTDYVIVVPEEFKKKKELYDWPKANNIRFEFIKENERIYGDEEKDILKGAFLKTRLLKKYVIKECAESVFLISLMSFLPFLPFMVPKNVNVSGILYKVYLYRWKGASLSSRMIDVLRYLIIRGHNCLTTVYILNDAPSARLINRIFKTNKFRFVTDPYYEISYTPKDIRKDLLIPLNNKVFLHFGGLNRRKGTLLILEAIKHLDKEQKKRNSFIFAGRVYDPIHDEFYEMVEELRSDCNIIVIDQFVSNEQLADLCVTTDFILTPYSVTTQSSGVLGYAAFYGKPVIGPSQGLVGKLIKRYHLGVAMDRITSSTLATTIAQFEPYILDSQYKNLIKVETFVNTVFEQF